MKKIYKAKEIASFYIQLLNSIPDNYIDNLKLNKILFFAQAWSLVKTGQPIFEDEIQAWDYGPVVPDVYRIYKCCGKSPIEEAEESFDESNLDSDELNLLIDVYRNYGIYTGWALKDITHEKGSPWFQVYEKGKNRPIPQDMMKAYYSGKKLDTFDPSQLDIPVITAIPLAWDSPEDAAYD